MVARQQMGDIFLGVTPSAIRQYMRDAFEGALGQYDKLIIPCAGRFTIAEAAIDAGWRAQEIECSDISLFSSVLGFYSDTTKDKEELGVVFSGVLDGFHARSGGNSLAGQVLLGLKLHQLSEKKLYEKQVRDELLEHADDYIHGLEAQVGELSQKLRGITYKIMDVREHVEEHKDNERALIYVNPPGFSRGYAKMFDTKGAITWNDPQIAEFDAKASRLQLYHQMMPAPALVYFFRSKQVEEGFGDRAVFAAERGRQYDYVLCNRPDEAARLVKRRGVTKIKPGKLPFLPDDYEIKPDSKIDFVEVEKAVALYYRDLFAHKLGVTRAERYFVATLDGYLMAVFGMFFSEVQRGQSGTVYETFGFTVPNKRYPRLNRLFMTAIVCDDARKCFTDHCWGALGEATRFQTTCISTTPEQKTHRGSLKLISREQMPDGRFKLVYGGNFKEWGFQTTLDNWFKRMRNVEKETKRPMGVDLIPNAEQAKANLAEDNAA